MIPNMVMIMISSNTANTQPVAVAPVLHLGVTAVEGIAAPVEGIEPSPHAESLRLWIAVGQSGLTLR